MKKSLAFVFIASFFCAPVWAHSTDGGALGLAGASGWRILQSYLALGIGHILIGYDHILFLTTLLLPAGLVRVTGRWENSGSLGATLRDIAIVVTVFTFSHSITLGLATFGVVSLPERPVEAVIALSIIAAAVANLFSRGTTPRVTLAFAFGLVHGFGFASVLRDVGLPPAATAAGLVGFNLGVEIGQLMIVAVVLPILVLLRGFDRLRHWSVTVGSTATAAGAAVFLGSV